jgi:branched-chain amino acid transport system substrate-binding protein
MTGVQRLTSLLVGVAVAAAMVLASPAEAADPKGKPWRIPFMVSMSGVAAAWGDMMWDGTLVGEDMVNAAGGINGRPVKAYVVDAPFEDLPFGVSVFKKLARDPDVPIILNVGGTSLVVAVHDLAEQYKIPVFAYSSAGFWRLGHFNQWMFRSLPQAHSAVPVFLPKAQKRFNIKKAALLYTHDDEAVVANAQIWRAEAKKLGIELVESTGKTGDTDFKAQVTKLKGANVDVFFGVLQAFDGGQWIGQARDAGLNQPVLGGLGISQTDYWKMSKGKVAKTDTRGGTYLYSLYDPGDPRPYVKDMQAAFRKRFDREPSLWSMLCIDGVLVTANIIKNAGGDLSREGIRKAFSATKAIESLSGSIGWDGSGDAMRQGNIIVMWEDGKLVSVPESFWEESGS